MPSKMVLFGITVLAVVIIISGLSYTILNSQLAANSSGNPEVTPTPSDVFPTENPDIDSEPTISPEPSLEPSPSEGIYLEEQMRDAAMSYIKTNHPQTAPLMTDLNWIGGRIDTDEPTETYVYYASGWTVTLNYSLESNQPYTVSAECSWEGIYVTWGGTYQNGSVKETNYTYNRQTSGQITP